MTAEQQRAGRALGVILLVLLIVAGLSRLESPSKSNPASASSAISSAGTVYHEPPPYSKEVLLQHAFLDFTWGKEADVFMVANFTVKNSSDYPFKDFEITCQHFSPSGTNIDSNVRTIYEVVKPHSTKKIRHFDMGFVHSQSVNANCKITNLVPGG